MGSKKGGANKRAKSSEAEPTVIKQGEVIEPTGSVQSVGEAVDLEEIIEAWKALAHSTRDLELGEKFASINASFYQAALSFDFPSITLDPRITEFEKELAHLQDTVSRDVLDLLESPAGKPKKEERVRELEGQIRDLKDRQSLHHLLSRVTSRARSRLLSDLDFRSKFDGDQTCSAFVISMDIRRSTELMLKSREPRLFAGFISSLASQLREKIVANLGVFDKFTGDGVLAFFPAFYSGEDAGYRAVATAAECHEVFNSHYEKNRHCFVSVLSDIGLGIGVDYGQVQMVKSGGDLTVVGTPVVYACRMGGAPAGHTYLNQPAYEHLFNRYVVFDYNETRLDFKHEGGTVAYSVRPNGKDFSPANPDWLVEELEEE